MKPADQNMNENIMERSWERRMEEELVRMWVKVRTLVRL